MQHFNFTCRCPCHRTLQLQSIWDQPETPYSGFSCVFAFLQSTSQLNCVDTLGQKKELPKSKHLQVFESFTGLCRHHCLILTHEDCKGIKKNRVDTQLKWGGTAPWCNSKPIHWQERWSIQSFTWFHTLRSIKGKQYKSPYLHKETVGQKG